MSSSTHTLSVADFDALTGDSEHYTLSKRRSEHVSARVWFYVDAAPRVVSRNGERYRVSCAESHTSHGESEPRLWVFLIATNKRTGADYKSGRGIWVTFGPDSRKPQHWLGESFDVVERYLIDAGLLVDDSAPIGHSGCCSDWGTGHDDATCSCRAERVGDSWVMSGDAVVEQQPAPAKRLDEYVGDNPKPLPVRGGKRNVKRSRKSGDPRADRAAVATLADLPFVVLAEDRLGCTYTDSRWPTRAAAQTRLDELTRGGWVAEIYDTTPKPCSACGTVRGSGCAVCRPDSVLGG